MAIKINKSLFDFCSLEIFKMGKSVEKSTLTTTGVAGRPEDMESGLIEWMRVMVMEVHCTHCEYTLKTLKTNKMVIFFSFFEKSDFYVFLFNVRWIA